MIVYGPKRWKYLSSFLSWVQLKMSSRGAAQVNGGLAVAPRWRTKCNKMSWVASLAGVARASTGTNQPNRRSLKVELSCRKDGEVRRWWLGNHLNATRSRDLVQQSRAIWCRSSLVLAQIEEATGWATPGAPRRTKWSPVEEGVCRVR